ncbi:MAG: YeeE/YedE family protein, partial [Sneathiella sp.]|nr:YeeE/YedE family protein [Sneathiella sp.]
MFNIISVLSGTIFGFGLALSGMLSPGKVVGFLDITGNWDPSLAFVMGGGVTVTVVSFHFLLKR